MTDTTGYVGTTVRMGLCYDCWTAFVACEEPWRLKYRRSAVSPEVAAFISASKGLVVIQDDERNGDIIPHAGPCFFCGATEGVFASYVTGDFRDWGLQ